MNMASEGLDSLHDAGSVVAIIGAPHAASLVGRGLAGLGHRASGLPGLVVGDGSWWSQVSGSTDETIAGDRAVGRRCSHGDEGPLLRWLGGRRVALAQVGGLVNRSVLLERIDVAGTLREGSDDAELLLHLLALSAQDTFVNRLVEAVTQVSGAFSLAVLCGDLLVVVRDPWGLRPLWLGRRGEAHVAATEPSVIGEMDGEVSREVLPGELVVLETGRTPVSLRPWTPRVAYPCAMEAVHLARLDGMVGSSSVYMIREALGRRLAQAAGIEADGVVAAPGCPGGIASGYASEADLPLLEGLLSSAGSGEALMGVPALVAGRRIVVVDDLLLRGARQRAVAAALRRAGAREIHLRLAVAPVTDPCLYGNHLPAPLIASRLSREDRLRYIGVKSIDSLSPESLEAVLGASPGSWCDACMTGRYPVVSADLKPSGQLPLFRSQETV